jgi:GntR family transcriptional regulator, vanillate catabolism transcriptional regulator
VAGFAQGHGRKGLDLAARSRRDGDAGTDVNRSAMIIENIRTAVLDGRLKPGERINEVQLSKGLGVSRTPVRNALQTLVGEGLVTYTPNKGYSARSYEVSEIIDAFEMRALAEGLAARLAAERGLSVEDEMDIERSLTMTDAALGLSDMDEARYRYSEANTIFHSAIHRAARSRLVTDVINLCQRVPQAYTKNVMAFTIGDVSARNELHHRIYEALLARKPQEAQALMVEHVTAVRRAITRKLATGAIRQGG